MAVTWKKIALADEVGSLGTIDQTIPASVDRTIQINGGSLNVTDLAESSENYLKIAQPSITLGSVSSSYGNENAKLQCKNSVSAGLSWTNGTGGASSTEGVSRFRVTNSPLTLQNHPSGALSSEFLKGPSFVMKNNGLGLGQNIAQSLGVTVNGPNGLDSATVYGGIQWDVTTVGNNITDATDPDHFTKFETKCTIGTQKGIGNGSSDFLFGNVTALELTGGPDAADNGHTANEQTLSEVSFYGTELEALTRRNLITIQCGTNGTITASSGGTASQPLKMVNGVECVAGTTLSGAHGIVLPFGGFVVGGSFSCQRVTAANQGANVSLFVRRVFANAGTSHHDIRVATNTGTALPTQIVSDSYPVDSTNHRTTGNTGVQFNAGDVLVPILEVDADTGDTTSVQRVIAQIFIYTESIVA